jgi:hypothetical protein
MKTVTVVEVAQMFNIKKRSARAKLYSLVQTGRATQLNPKVGPKNPGIYQLHIPLKDLFMTQSDISIAREGKTNYKRFCADPFNLTSGARGEK